LEKVNARATAAVTAMMPILPIDGDETKLLEPISLDDAGEAFMATADAAAEESSPVPVDDRAESENTPLADTKPKLGKKVAKRRLQSPLLLRGALGFRTRTRMHRHWCAKHQAEATEASAENIRVGPAKP
jgi:hypothetical protein